MNVDEIVLSLIRENVEKRDDVSLNSDLRKDLGIDSFESTMVLNALEDKFNIHIDEVEFNSIVQVSDIILLLRKRYLKSEDFVK